VDHVCQNSIVQDAWKRGQDLTVHGFVYDLRDGIMRDMGIPISSAAVSEYARQQSVDEMVLRPVRSGRLIKA
jgi:carbonic anhydrase